MTAAAARVDAPPAIGTEWVVDAFGCDPEALRSETRLRSVFDRAVAAMELHPLAPVTIHAFPHPGGLTAILLLSESHIACHTFPEYGYAALNIYSCRPRPAWDFRTHLGELLGAGRVEVRALARGGVPAGLESP